MTPVNIEIQDDEVQAMLKHLLDATGDLTPALDAIGQELESRVSARFETETDPSGVPWAPLAPATVKTYPKGGNGRILDRLGDYAWQPQSPGGRRQRAGRLRPEVCHLSAPATNPAPSRCRAAVC